MCTIEALRVQSSSLYVLVLAIDKARKVRRRLYNEVVGSLISLGSTETTPLPMA